MLSRENLEIEAAIRSYCTGRHAVEFQVDENMFVWLPSSIHWQLVQDNNMWEFPTEVDCLLVSKVLSVSTQDMIGNYSSSSTVKVDKILCLRDKRRIMQSLFRLNLNFEIIFVFENLSGEVCLTSIYGKKMSSMKSVGQVNNIFTKELATIPTLSGYYTKAEQIESCRGEFRYELLEPIPGSPSSEISLVVTSAGLRCAEDMAENLEKAVLRVRYVSQFAGDLDSHNNTSECHDRLDYLRKFASFRASDKTVTPLMHVDDMIENLILRIKETGYVRNINSEANSDGLGYRDCFPMSNLDFLDIFWDFLTGFSYVEAKYAFSSFLRRVLAGDLIPLISKENKCQLSQSLRDWITYSQLNTSTECMDRQQSLKSLFEYWMADSHEIITEMGISVLTKEYVQFLVHQNYCSMADIEKYLTTEIPQERQISNLVTLHSLVEVVCLISANFLSKVTLETLRAVLSKVLSYYSTKDCLTFSFGIHIQLPIFSTTTVKMVESIIHSNSPKFIRYIIKFPSDEAEIYLQKSGDRVELDEVYDWKLSYKKKYHQ